MNRNVKEIVIIGAGGFGREVAWLIEEINANSNEWNLVGFVDDSKSIQGEMLNGYKVVGDINWLKTQSVYAVCAIGDPKIKQKIIERLEGKNVEYPVLIHPNVKYSKYVSFGEGSIICLDTILTTNITVGKHVIINLDCTIGHDAKIGNFSTILPSVNVSGYVNLGECVSVGTSSAIIQGLNIGENTTIGAGSVVIRDLPKNCVAVGSPAKPIKYLEEK